MADPDLSSLRLDDLSLEPLPSDPVAGKQPPAAGRATFQVDMRGGRERRQQPERRKELRLQDDRRSGKDRRPNRTWEPGRNL